MSPRNNEPPESRNGEALGISALFQIAVSRTGGKFPVAIRHARVLQGQFHETPI